MNIDEHLELLETKNKKLFGSVHLLYLLLAIGVMALVLVLSLPPALAGIITGILAFFLLYYYVGYSMQRINSRITLLETKYKSLGSPDS